MKKMLMILLAALLLCLPFSALAEGDDATPPPLPEEPELEPLPDAFLPLERRVLGDWYGDYAGLVFSLSLAEDLNYAAVFPGAEPKTGQWALTDGYIVLDENERDSLLPLSGGLLWGDLLLTREKPEAYVPAEVLADAEEGAFDGFWKSQYVVVGEGVLYAAALGEDAYVYIEGTRVALGGSRFGNVIRTFRYEDGALVLDEEGLTVRIELQQDGLLRLTDGGEAPLTICLQPFPFPDTEPQEP